MFILAKIYSSMISNTKFYLILCFLITLGHNSFSQKTNKRVAKADQAFALEEYYKAAELYKKAYEKTKTPNCLPRNKPKTIPNGTLSNNDEKDKPSKDTPAFAKAKIGIIPNAT